MKRDGATSVVIQRTASLSIKQTMSSEIDVIAELRMYGERPELACTFTASLSFSHPPSAAAVPFAARRMWNTGHGLSISAFRRQPALLHTVSLLFKHHPLTIH